jgi:hypothetical protein
VWRERGDAVLVTFAFGTCAGSLDGSMRATDDVAAAVLLADDDDLNVPPHSAAKIP